MKRTLDVVVAALALVAVGWVIGLACVLALIDTGESGIFGQVRVGRYGKKFRVLKIRTMRSDAAIATTVTPADDPRITRLGRFLRRAKIDELPQLINVLMGDMSLVGPRPDVPSFADRLEGPDRIILSVRPGITGPATLKFRDEEEILARQKDPESYNRHVIFPEKVRLNREYVKNYTLLGDIMYLIRTVLGR